MSGARRPLFRAEAVAAQRGSALGRVVLVRPLALSWLTAGIVLAVLLLLAFLSLASYTRKSTAPGLLVPDRGLIRLVAGAAGSVVERRVVEGQQVAAGDVLFVVALDRAVLAPQADAEVAASLEERRRSLLASAQQQQALTASRAQALQRRLAALDAEQAQLDREAALLKDRLVLAQQALERLESLQRSAFISSAQVQAKAEELLALRGSQQALERQRATLQREREELLGEQRALPLAAAGATGALERDLAALQREAVERDVERRVVVRAPQAGQVGALLAEPGQSVAASAVLATLVPQGAALQAQLFAPSAAIGFVREGQPVRLRFDAYPYQKYGQRDGQVLRVSRTPLSANELAAMGWPDLAPGGRAEPLFRIVVALGPPPPEQAGLALTAGMRLAAEVQLERRRLLEYLFEPLLALRARS